MDDDVTNVDGAEHGWTYRTRWTFVLDVHAPVEALTIVDGKLIVLTADGVTTVELPEGPI